MQEPWFSHLIQKILTSIWFFQTINDIKDFMNAPNDDSWLQDQIDNAVTDHQIIEKKPNVTLKEDSALLVSVNF